MTQDEIRQLFIELTKLIASGFIGGAVASLFSLRVYNFQKKIDAKNENKKKQLDGLRDIDLILPWLHRDIHYNWEKPLNKGQSPEEHITNLVNKISYVETLFLNDPETLKILGRLMSLVGAGADSFFGESKIFENPPGKFIIEIREAIRQKISEIEKSITS